jgi:peptidylprolyl isomerase
VLVDGQSMSVHYLMVSGDDGSMLTSTWETGAPTPLTVGDPSVIGALNDVLKDQRVGVRIVVAAPSTAATADVAASAAMIMVLEVLDARDVPTRASGEAVEPPAGLPVVTLAEDGEPAITIPADAQEPTELVTQTLIKGDGAVIEAGQNIIVHYNGWLWDGTLFDSSWEAGQTMATPIGAGELIPGWDQGLVGQTIGSQVLLVVPPELGYGVDGYNEIPPNATLIFVVDLLDVA